MEKQEKTETVDKTLEEAALNFAIAIQTKECTVSRLNAIEWFKAGAKYQSEKLFTEDDMRRAYSYGMFAVTTGRNFKDWFINYKSK
jgi:hypothetical protein